MPCRDHKKPLSFSGFLRSLKDLLSPAAPRTFGPLLSNPLSLRDIPLFMGNAGTCCATLAEPGWLHCFNLLRKSR